MSPDTEERPLVVWCAATSWDRVPRGNDRPLALELQRHADILWVDPPVSFVTPARFSSASRFPWPTLVQISPALHRLTPRAHPFHTRVLTKLSASLVRIQIRWALRRLQRRPRAVVASLSTTSWAAGRRRTRRSVRYRRLRRGCGSHARRPPCSRARGAVALERADRAVVISPAMADRWRRLGFDRPLAVVPNGADISACQGLDRVARAEEWVSATIAGLIGQLSARVDITLLESVLEAGCSLLLVAPATLPGSRNVWTAPVHPRVCWVRPRPVERLPTT